MECMLFLMIFSICYRAYAHFNGFQHMLILIIYSICYGVYAHFNDFQHLLWSVCLFK